jgi:single-stranded-DNA-specific exonuclease
VVNLHRPDSSYSDAGWPAAASPSRSPSCSADQPGGPAFALGLADLATIGTVADVAPIVGENRSIARIGLERLRTSPRPGIAALLERARIAPDGVDLETISFALAPRLNAAGRMGEALQAASCFCRSASTRPATPMPSRAPTLRGGT